MARAKRTIRASEIGSFLYCQRAWWYQRRKVKPANQSELSEGLEYHGWHWLGTSSARSVRTAAWVLLLAALVLLGIALGLRAAS